MDDFHEMDDTLASGIGYNGFQLTGFMSFVLCLFFHGNYTVHGSGGKGKGGARN